MSTTYLITGANRGFGLALTTIFLARPSTTVVAAVRDPSKAKSGPFAKLEAGHDSKLVVVSYDASSETSPKAAIHQLTQEHGIKTLDVVVANAGIAPTKSFKPIANADPAELQEHIAVNGIAPLLLFQAVLPLLSASAMPNGPKFLLMGSMNGSIGGIEQFPYPMGIYGASKALAHYTIRKLHSESGNDEKTKNFVVWAVDPGFVQTELGNEGARFFGMEGAPVKLDDSAKWIVQQIDGATREATGGRFPSISGGETAW